MFLRKRRAQRLDTEIQFHLDQQIAENVEAGMNPREARYTAMRTFGNPTSLKEETRDTWGWTWLEEIAQDLYYGFRTLRNSPSFTAVAVLTLALGIGITASVLTVCRATILQPLPVPEPDRVVRLFFSTDRSSDTKFTFPGYLDLRGNANTI